MHSDDGTSARRGLHPAVQAMTAVALAGAGVLAYSALFEVRSYRLRRVTVPMLPAGAPSMRVLHISDLHFTPGQRRKADWVRDLAALEPDLVINTGDNLSHAGAIPMLLTALEPLLAYPGAFVFGSNDYWGPVFSNPLRYLTQRGDTHAAPAHLPERALATEEIRAAFDAAGWLDLDNARGQLEVDGRTVALVGVDDPHIHRDTYAAVAGTPEETADVAIGVTHAPYRRVLESMAADHWPLILAGHTHGGQVCIPGYGALVTNCDLDTARVRGLSRFEQSWLHVSAGLGTSRFAPVRFACPPEASLLTLVPAHPLFAGTTRPRAHE